MFNKIVFKNSHHDAQQLTNKNFRIKEQRNWKEGNCL